MFTYFTTLELILIAYITLSWFITIIMDTVPVSSVPQWLQVVAVLVLNPFILIPAIITGIVERIKKNKNKQIEQVEES